MAGDRRSAPRGEAPGGGAPRVSVIVPFLDGEPYIRDCAEALLAQEDIGGRFEIIFVDNGSTDGSAGIVGRYDRIRLVEEPKPGAYAARNAGLRVARGPVIAFTDADCVPAPDWLRSIMEGMRDPDIGILLGDVRYPASASLPLRVLGVYENAKVDYVLSRCPRQYHFGYTNNMAVRAELFRETGPFEEWRRAADSEFVHRVGRRRPELRTAYRRCMRVRHLEFTDFRSRARRLLLYTKTNTKIGTFRELGMRRRIGVLLHMLARR